MKRSPQGPRLPTDDYLLSLPPDARAWVVARLRAGLNQSAAAKAADISTCWLWQIETGRGVPSRELAIRLRLVYGIEDVA